ncbi:OST-HTH/LOTUS domain-containing protein [Rhizobium lusitanum]|uniref:OST-HTH/LOTUS domain-containing protein n=1 Tax=Rhizobium lusitanum TaxID=293958 RepID=UPI0039170EAC
MQPPSAAVSLIKKVLSQEDAEDGWVSLGTVGKQVLNLAPDFDPRTFGFKKLSDLVRKTNQFEVQQGEGGPIRIRMKRAAGK